MSIWVYADVPREEFPYGHGKSPYARKGSERGQRIVDLWYAKTCAFCGSRMMPLPDAEGVTWWSGTIGGQKHETQPQIHVCKSCGWWTGRLEHVRKSGSDEEFLVLQGGASLKELALADISVPVEEVKQYLLAKYIARFSVHPRVFEETVASVFRSLGFAASATAYSADGGIDVILERGSDCVGVQVKRHTRSIAVEQIRSLAGALLLQGQTKGMFVTTSTFQRGAPDCVADYRMKGYQIELVDGEQFYDKLRIVRRPLYQSLRGLEGT